MAMNTEASTTRGVKASVLKSCLGRYAAAATEATAPRSFRRLRKPVKPSKPKPPANSASAPGSGVAAG